MPLQAHRGEKGGEIGARKYPPRAGRPGSVHRVAPVVEQHPEASDRFPERAGVRRTLVRSSVERGMVIMIVQPSSNKAEVLRASRS